MSALPDYNVSYSPHLDPEAYLDGPQVSDRFLRSHGGGSGGFTFLQEDQFLVWLFQIAPIKRHWHLRDSATDFGRATLVDLLIHLHILGKQTGPDEQLYRSVFEQVLSEAGMAIEANQQLRLVTTDQDFRQSNHRIDAEIQDLRIELWDAISRDAVSHEPLQSDSWLIGGRLINNKDCPMPPPRFQWGDMVEVDRSGYRDLRRGHALGIICRPPEVSSNYEWRYRVRILCLDGADRYIPSHVFDCVEVELESGTILPECCLDPQTCTLATPRYDPWNETPGCAIGIAHETHTTRERHWRDFCRQFAAPINSTKVTPIRIEVDRRAPKLTEPKRAPRLEAPRPRPELPAPKPAPQLPEPKRAPQLEAPRPRPELLAPKPTPQLPGKRRLRLPWQ